MEHIYVSRWDGVADLMLESAIRVQRSGAEFVVCPDNTVHEAYDAVVKRSPLPWLHIAEEVTKTAHERGFKKLLVLGTRYLMEGPVYPAKLRACGIESEIPVAAAREKINKAIFDELVYGRFTIATRSCFVEVIDDHKARGCDAVVLGCTEIPLLISQEDSPLPILDSTRLLARAALRKAVSE
jgi:aspartate racemase